ncbi:hypothetical protein ACFO4E_23190 [Nocardiopsis mangrovi]|uniref:ABC transporter permease n=1 Tax=Nocardiopsis mangrovi TaxID=1179818 RepID=A0ABV9E0U4_9ACTN
MTASFLRLVGFESLRLARSPLLYVAIAFALVTVVGFTAAGTLGSDAFHLWTMRPSDSLPTWGAVVDDMVSCAKYISAGMFFAAFPLALREARHGHSVVAPLGRRARVAALLAATVLVGGLTGALSFAVLLIPQGPVAIAGGTSAAAFTVPLILPMAGGALGVLAGLWTRSRVAMIATAVATVAFGAARFITVPLVDQVYGLPDALVQPAGVYDPGVWGIAPIHLAYVLLLLGAIATLALLRHRRGRRDTGVIALAAAVCVTGSAVTFSAQFGYGELLGVGPRKWADMAAPDTGRVCQTPTAVTYCSYEGYEHWIPYWREAVEPVVRAVPETEHDRLPVVRQVVAWPPLSEGDTWPPEGMADPGAVWSERPEQRVDLADQVALVALGAPEYRFYSCKLTGQARLPVYLWLTTYGIEGYRDLVYPAYENRAIIHTFDIALAVALSQTPDDEVIAALHRNWDRLVAPATTPEQAAGLLGVEVTAMDLKHADALLAPFRGTAIPDSEFESPDEENPVPRMRAVRPCR